MLSVRPIVCFFLMATAAAGCGGDAVGAAGTVDVAEDVHLGPPVCVGDELLDDVPLSTDLFAFGERWDENRELLRVLFVGGPT